jgi:hypothetical protein
VFPSTGDGMRRAGARGPPLAAHRPLSRAMDGLEHGRSTRRGRGGESSGLRARTLGVQVDYNVVHLRTSLVQLFVLLLQNFEKVVQMIKLKRFEGAPNGYPFAPLTDTTEGVEQRGTRACR